ncbi:MAG: 50S ribosomal protein L21e [archaeon]
MATKKKRRTKGKLPFSKYFQKFKGGERVAVVRELSVPVNFPKRLQGRTGVVGEKVGRTYFVKIKDQNKEKKFLIHPVNLKKMETAK